MASLVGIPRVAYRKLSAGSAFLSIILMLASFASGAEKPNVVPGLVGGVSPAAVFGNHGFFGAARACFKQYPFSEFNAAAAARQKNCLGDYMKRNGAAPQAIAFMRAAPVPAAIAAVRNYGAADVVYSRMMWADASGGWAIIGRSGVLVPLWLPPPVSHDPAYLEFVHNHPGSLLWSDNLIWPPAASSSDGSHLRFLFSFKTCHACAKLGTATIVYDFDREGQYEGARLDRIEVQTATP
jgi:hypothetical protein